MGILEDHHPLLRRCDAQGHCVSSRTIVGRVYKTTEKHVAVLFSVGPRPRLGRQLANVVRLLSAIGNSREPMLFGMWIGSPAEFARNWRQVPDAPTNYVDREELNQAMLVFG